MNTENATTVPEGSLEDRTVDRPGLRRAGTDRTPVDWLPVMVVALMLVAGILVAVALGTERSRPGPWPAPSQRQLAAAETMQVEPATSLTVTEPSGPAKPGMHAAVTWVAAVARVTGIPPVALRAYANASLSADALQPACRVGWTTLAAIGGVESGHGTHGGATLREDGTTSVPIIGPALDGRDGFAAIRATPQSTSWHGDPTWDHAVGPLQFLPSTWIRWGADGDGDGTADPNDIDDAALATARYLCASGADLAVGAAWRAAVFSYNHSDQYVTDVLRTADGYATASRAAGTGAGG
jgi:membrane-bound lytic murein transglycosylase B